MRKFEAKLSRLERDILAVKDEKTVLKPQQANQTKEVESLKEERDYYKSDYKGSALGKGLLFSLSILFVPELI